MWMRSIRAPTCSSFMSSFAPSGEQSRYTCRLPSAARVGGAATSPPACGPAVRGGSSRDWILALDVRAIAYDVMRHRILRHIGQRTEMLAAVSHDLRTPLTRMRLELELLGVESDPVLVGLRDDVEEMARLVEEYGLRRTRFAGIVRP